MNGLKISAKLKKKPALYSFCFASGYNSPKAKLHLQEFHLRLTDIYGNKKILNLKMSRLSFKMVKKKYKNPQDILTAWQAGLVVS